MAPPVLGPQVQVHYPDPQGQRMRRFLQRAQNVMWFVLGMSAMELIGRL